MNSFISLTPKTKAGRLLLALLLGFLLFPAKAFAVSDCLAAGGICELMQMTKNDKAENEKKEQEADDRAKQLESENQNAAAQEAKKDRSMYSRQVDADQRMIKGLGPSCATCNCTPCGN
ncbi:MAG: hypothetical protein ACXVB9_02550 [Bdellovibrionota bacterium]